MTKQRVAVVAAVFLALVCLGTAPSRAAAPRQQGWWTASPVPGPDVADDGLLVEGAAASPTSFAALVFDVASDATVGKLKLAVTPSSATIPNVALQLCPLAEPAIQPVQGGPMADAPEFDCATNVTAQPGSDGTTYEFDVASLLGDGVLAVAILGTTPADRVVLSAPDGNSLPVEQAATTSTGDSPSSAGVGSGSMNPDRAFTTPAAPPPAPAVPAGDGAATADRSSDGARAGSGYAAPDTSSPDDETAESRELLLVLLGAVVLVSVWLAIGHGAAIRAAAGSSMERLEGVSR